MILRLRPALVFFLVLLLAAPQVGFAARKAKTPKVSGEGLAKLTGQVRDTAGKGVEGATITLTPVEKGGSPLTFVTGNRGSFIFEGLHSGYYTLTFEIGGTVYPGNRVLLISPRKAHKAEFTLGNAGPQDLLPGTGGTPAPGAPIARLLERTGPTGLEWFTTGKGVAVLVGGVALTVAGLIALTSDEEEKSASASTTEDEEK